MNPVDLTNLRAMIDNDRDMEAELITEFYRATEEGLKILGDNLHNPERWRQQAHALKGIALNLGAEALGELAKIAQLSFEKTPAEKQELLAALNAEYAVAKHYLSTQPH
jgi:HPt (histidine-containing phosphotransfer) domain-containing protein